MKFDFFMSMKLPSEKINLLFKMGNFVGPIQYLSMCTPVLVSRSHSEWICICHLIVFVCARHLHFQSADPIPMGFASAGHV